MKPSKTKMRAKKATMTNSKIKIKSEPSGLYPKSPERLIRDAGEVEEFENEGKQALDWLTSAFPCISVDQIDSVYREAGDVYLAAGILGAEFVDPGENPRSSPKNRSARKQKRLAASTGMVSGVIGKDYLKPASDCSAWRRSLVDPKEQAVSVNRSKEAEDFFCSILASDSELSMGVVRDVSSHCGHNLGKYTDKPSVPTFHLSAKEHDNLQYVGSSCRDYVKVTLNIKDQTPLQSGIVNSDLQQMVLESLFNNPEGPAGGNNVRWKKIIEQVESFGQGLRFTIEDSTESSSECRSVGGEDGYHVFRSVAQKNWNTMRSYYHKATLAYSNGERSHASYLSEKGRLHKKLALEADEKASQEIFESRNSGIRNTVTIDLHGQHVKQAIRLVKLHLLLFAYIPSVQFLRVITGCGADGLGQGKLKRTVLDLMRKECIKYSEENSGTLLLSIGVQRSFTFTASEIESD